MSKSYVSSKAIIKKSKIHGFSVFTNEIIKKDEIFAIKGGSIITKNKLDGMNEKMMSACLQIEDNFFTGPNDEKEYSESMVGVNHSCEPNGGFKGNIIGVAMRDIQSGEEITQDYAMFNTSQFGNFKCNCGSSSCRKIVTPNDWKDKNLQKKYGNYFSQYILDKIKK